MSSEAPTPGPGQPEVVLAKWSDSFFAWMKYYNNELDQKGRAVDEKEILELLGEVKKSIEDSLKMLEESNLGGPAK